MYELKTNQIEDRIVSISQPHIRPIVRGKARAQTEFGAKIIVSLVDGFAFVEKLDWNNFNEGTLLIDSIERYQKRHGYYPKVACADRIFRNRKNLEFCKQNGIRLSGPRLGRPNIKKLKSQKRIERIDNRIRNEIEGKLGEGKRCYGLGCIMAKLQETSECVIHLQFLVMNLQRKLRLFFVRFFLERFELSMYGFVANFAVN